MGRRLLIYRTKYDDGGGRTDLGFGFFSTLFSYSDLSFSPTTVDHKHAIAASLTRFALPFVDGLSDFCAALCALAKWTVLDLAWTLVNDIVYMLCSY